MSASGGRGTHAHIRPARAAEAAAIASLLAPYAALDLVLPRSPAEIEAQIGAFLVAVGAAAQSGNGPLLGCVSLRDYGNGLFEVRSLAVTAACSGQGIGSQLVRDAVRLAGERGAERVFALTLRPHLFARLGFRTVPKELFPEKVWADCRRCKKREHCDEVAVLLVPPQPVA
jgi:amino-acid N-acetyltransferase